MSTFLIPMMFLQCLTWEPRDGETIRGFSFDQPVSILVENGKSVIVQDSTFIITYGCVSLVANNHSAIDLRGSIYATTNAMQVRNGK